MYGGLHNLRVKMQYAWDFSRWLLKYRDCDLGRQNFTFRGREFPYFVHPYNQTWANERAVEIPVARAACEGRDSRRPTYES